MQTVTDYSAVPANAAYLGSQHPDGTIEEATADAIADALHPLAYRDDDGITHYFDRVTA